MTSVLSIMLTTTKVTSATTGKNYYSFYITNLKQFSQNFDKKKKKYSPTVLIEIEQSVYA
jgi:hypothetical protein